MLPKQLPWAVIWEGLSNQPGDEIHEMVSDGFWAFVVLFHKKYGGVGQGQLHIITKTRRGEWFSWHNRFALSRTTCSNSGLKTVMGECRGMGQWSMVASCVFGPCGNVFFFC